MNKCIYTLYPDNRQTDKGTSGTHSRKFLSKPGISRSRRLTVCFRSTSKKVPTLLFVLPETVP